MGDWLKYRGTTSQKNICCWYSTPKGPSSKSRKQLNLTFLADSFQRNTLNLIAKLELNLSDNIKGHCLTKYHCFTVIHIFQPNKNLSTRRKLIKPFTFFSVHKTSIGLQSLCLQLSEQIMNLFVKRRQSEELFHRKFELRQLLHDYIAPVFKSN